MKKSLLLMACLIGISTLHAQHAALDAKDFRDNWSIGFYGGGVTAPNQNGKNHTGSSMGFIVNKQNTSFYGISLENMWSADTYHSSAIFDASNLALLSRLKLNDILRKYRGVPTLFDIEFASGLGWYHVNDAYLKKDGKTSDGNWLSSKMGLNINLNLGRTKAWTVGLRPYMLCNLTPDKEGIRFTPKKVVYEVTAGVTYHFKRYHTQYHTKR